MGSWFKGGGGTYLKIGKGDDPIFLNLARNNFALIHVSMIRMCNKTTPKASLYQQNLLCLNLLQKQSAKTIGNYCFSSLNISGIRKC